MGGSSDEDPYSLTGQFTVSQPQSWLTLHPTGTPAMGHSTQNNYLLLFFVVVVLLHCILVDYMLFLLMLFLLFLLVVFMPLQGPPIGFRSAATSLPTL